MSLPPDALVDLIALMWSLRRADDPDHPTHASPPLPQGEDGSDHGSSNIVTSPNSPHSNAIMHNSALPVNRLPSELLCNIFLFLRPNIVPFQELGSGRLIQRGREHRPNIAWLFAMTHVCGYWRQIACGEPTLWDHLALPESVTIKDRLGHVLIDRAGLALPLHLQEPITSSILFIHSLTPAQWTRLHTISLTPCPVGEVAARYALETLRPVCPPLLTTLALDLPMMSLPQIFEGKFPSLRHLTLVQASTWELNNDFSRVTYLKLASQPAHHRVAMPVFLHLLSRLPLLEYLSLDNAGPNAEEPSVVAHSVALPRLRTLELCDALPDPRKVLVNLELPIDCIIHCARHRSKSQEAVLLGPRDPAGIVSGLPCQPTIAVVDLHGPRSVDYDRLVFKSNTMYVDTREWSGHHAKGMKDVLETVTEIYVGAHSSYAVHCATVLWKGLLKKTPNVREITFMTGVHTASIIEEARKVEENIAEHLQHIRFRASAAKRLNRHVKKCPALDKLVDGTYVLWRRSIETGGPASCSIMAKDVQPPSHPVFSQD